MSAESEIDASANASVNGKHASTKRLNNVSVRKSGNAAGPE